MGRTFHIRVKNDLFPTLMSWKEIFGAEENEKQRTKKKTNERKKKIRNGYFENPLERNFANEAMKMKEKASQQLCDNIW